MKVGGGIAMTLTEGTVVCRSISEAFLAAKQRLRPT